MGFFGSSFFGGGLVFVGFLGGWFWFWFFLKENYFALMENVGPELEEIREIVTKPAPIHGSLSSC